MQFCCEFDGKSMETETETWSEFPSGGKDHLSKVIWDYNIRSSPGQSVPPEQVSQSLWGTLKSQKRKTPMGWSRGPHLC